MEGLKLSGKAHFACRMWAPDVIPGISRQGGNAIGTPGVLLSVMDTAEREETTAVFFRVSETNTQLGTEKALWQISCIDVL